MAYPARRKRKSPNPTKSVSLLRRDAWDDPTAPWLEEHIQAAIIIQLRKHNVEFEVGLEGVRLSKSQRAKAKIQGMEPGRCDIKIYLPEERMLHIELKRKGGRVSPEQADWHERLRRLGFTVHVVKASCPQDGIDKVAALVEQQASTTKINTPIGVMSAE
jgi:hypothetical protein